MKKSELIVRVLDVCNRRLELEDLDPEVERHARTIQARYSELKRHNDFETAAMIARQEFVVLILGDADTE